MEVYEVSEFRRKVFWGYCDAWVWSGNANAMVPSPDFVYDPRTRRYTVGERKQQQSRALGILTNDATVGDLGRAIDKEEKSGGKRRIGLGTFTTERCYIQDWSREYGHTCPTVQVASQFNAQEMQGPFDTPHTGISPYMLDETQGPSVVLSSPFETYFRCAEFPYYNALENWGVRLTSGGYFRPQSFLCEVPNERWDPQEVFIPHVSAALFIGYRKYGEYHLLPRKEQFRYHQVLTSGIEATENVEDTFERVATAFSQGVARWGVLDSIFRTDSQIKTCKRHKVALTLVSSGVWGNSPAKVERYLREAVKPYLSRYDIDWTLLV